MRQSVESAVCHLTGAALTVGCQAMTAPLVGRIIDFTLLLLSMVVWLATTKLHTQFLIGCKLYNT